MRAETQLSGAVRLLRFLEDGGSSAAQVQVLALDLDPVLLHAILRFLRATYPASNPLASAVLGRLAQLTASDPRIVARAKQGARDPVARWFDAEYDFSDFRGRGPELLALIVDKLES